MEEKKKWYQLGDAANRNRLATIIIWSTLGTIALLSYFFYRISPTADTMEDIFTTLIPLFATWVGTVLAFYFGKENFDIAAKRYDKIIDQLTPEVLDDVKVSQIMIAKKTMVYKDIAEVEGETIQNLIKFLNDIKKSRLPILNEGKIAYVIHKSTFLNAMSILKPEDAVKLDFKTFIANAENKAMASSFETFQEDVILEKIRAAIAKNEAIKDVFITDGSKNVVGWLTDTLILRFISGANKKKPQ